MSIFPANEGASFDTPLALLAACHERIEAQCATLARLLDYLPAHGADVPAQEAAARVIRYFDSAGRHHHEDEEQDLFPLLRAREPGCAPLLDTLISEHHDMERLWSGLRAELDKLTRGDAGALSRESARRFTEAYRAHIAREDETLLPLARRLLDEVALARLGEAMAARRGVNRT